MSEPNLIGKILACLNAGGTVTISNGHLTIPFHRNHVDCFRIGRDGNPYALHHGHWLNIARWSIKLSPAVRRPSLEDLFSKAKEPVSARH